MNIHLEQTQAVEREVAHIGDNFSQIQHVAQRLIR
jgi:hypothetical protein